MNHHVGIPVASSIKRLHSGGGPNVNSRSTVTKGLTSHREVRAERSKVDYAREHLARKSAWRESYFLAILLSNEKGGAELPFAGRRNAGWLLDMKKIEAIIKPFKLEEVKSGLAELGIEGMTVSEVKGYGNPTQPIRPSYGPTRLPFIPKLKVELIVRNELLGSAVAAIKQSARTGTRGDGKIFVQDLLEVIRIRTEERGDRAL
jgi:nitrogen regulatory protein P-II 1